MTTDLTLLHQLLKQQGKTGITDVNPETESLEYDAHTVVLNGYQAKYRKAKITPTKTGQFVTIWKRSAQGITEPCSVHDATEFYVIAARKEDQLGFFIFPSDILHQQKILSDEKRDGKRGIRVYPPWDNAPNKQAQKIQQWQVQYFSLYLQPTSI
ncbi:MepB family protein [Pedobacter sp. AW1-32]|uniref:MepB family protein n=1 Tax=Pedobacter sp. AW1-32 TaxID=3383026 RepID=UPI003FEF9B04